MMKPMIFGLASFLIAAFAFGFGAGRLFQRRKPLYFQLLVCAAGCFAVAQLSNLVNLWCGITQTVSTGMLGIFGCNFFLLSANYGTLDRLVDDGNGTQIPRRLAFLAPVVMAALTAVSFFTWKNWDLYTAITWTVMLLPALPASYFNLKHILLPEDPFLRATKACNFAALAFYVVTAVYVIGLGGSVLSVLMSLSVLGLTISAVKGASKWKI